MMLYTLLTGYGCFVRTEQNTADFDPKWNYVLLFTVRVSERRVKLFRVPRDEIPFQAFPDTTCSPLCLSCMFFFCIKLKKTNIQETFKW